MNSAWLSLLVLVVALVASCVSEMNVGILAIVGAWLVGASMGLRVEQIVAGFPSGLFVTLVGLTLLFAQAEENGTLGRVAERAVRLCRGNVTVVPLMFFVLTAAVSSIGPGNVAATALMAPLAMAVAGRMGISPFVMTIMVADGASAGSLSPVSTVGVIVNTLVLKLGLPAAQWSMFLNNFLVHMVVAGGGYLLFGGIRRSRRLESQRGLDAGTAAPRSTETAVGESGVGTPLPFDRRHRVTLAVIAAMAFCAVVFGVNVGMAACAGVLVMTMTRSADESAAIRRMPWKVILMVTGVTVLVALLEKAGGSDLFASILARMATPVTSTLVVAFFTGLISIYSSTSGVVLPAFIPMVPGLIAKIGGGDPMALIYSMNSAGHLVDVSPLSTLGALCLAAAPAGTDGRRLFNQLMAWGLSMSVVGALVCWLVFGLL